MNSLTGNKDTKTILRGWAEIARYLGRGIRTVQRWESELQLPLRRNGYAKRGGVVVTTTDELDRWVANTLVAREASLLPPGTRLYLIPTLGTA